MRDLALVIDAVRGLLPGVDPATIERVARDVPQPSSADPAPIDHSFAAEIDRAIGGASVLVTAPDPVEAGVPVDVVLGAHHLVVTRDPAVRLASVGAERPVGARIAERFIVGTHLDTVWYAPGLAEPQRNAVIARSHVLVAVTAAASTWTAVRAALALGTPVVARDVGALAAAVEGAALLLPTDTGARHVAVAVERVLRDRSLRDALSALGRARVEATSSLNLVPAVLRALHRELVS